MKTIVNKTRGPLRVPLPRGKTLHLGPGKSGQVAHHNLDHKPLKQLIEDGKIEIQEDTSTKAVGRERGRAPHESTSTHGHQRPSSTQVKGDR
jgi:hypothetical protein